MANPSLQIGNSNWAIKESNLLGYSTAGTRFVPQPITMTRASAGTRVNPQGLVETVELLGSEEITNGDFATDSDWNKSSKVTIQNGAAVFTLAPSGQQLSQSSTPAVSGKTYKISYEIKTRTQGAFSASIGGALSSNQNSSVGVYTEYLTATGAGIFYIRSRGTTSGSIDNVSVKESTKNNLARVDYDGTASSLLVEPERTNLVLRSQEIDNASWSKSSGGIGITPVVTADNVVSPDGVQNAEKVVFDLNGGGSGDESVYSLLLQNYTSVSGTTYSLSCYLKGENGGEQIIFDFDSQNSNVVTLTNEWVRYTFSKTVSTNGSRAIRFGSRGNNSGGTYGSDNPTVYIWGASLEVGSYPTSYIPTDGSTVTRVQELYSKTGISNLINSTEGVLFSEIAALSDDGTDRQICLRDDTWTNRMFLRLDASSNQITFRYYIGGSLTVNLIHTLTDITIFNKIACKWELNKFKLYVNGDKVAEDLSANVMGADLMNRIAFDDGLGTNVFYGKVKQLQVFKTALTDSELIALTT